MFQLSYAANKPAHEHHSANVIKLEGHEVMSADWSFRFGSVPLRKRKKRTGVQTSYALFLHRNLYRADLSSAECSGQIPISEETGEFFVARVWEP